MKKMKLGKHYNSGDVVLTKVQFTDTFETKIRPAVILFEEKGNFVAAGITSNLKMEGVALTQEEGAIKDSIIKLNYIFTISKHMIKKALFELSKQKKKQVFEELSIRLSALTS